MDLIFSLFQAYSMVNDATRMYGNVADWVIEIVNNWSQRQPAQVIEKQVGTMATATEETIRTAAAQAFARNPKSSVPAAKREELIGLMLNMVRNVRAQTSCGSLVSDGSFLRSERLLDMLLADVEPVRHVERTGRGRVAVGAQAAPRDGQLRRGLDGPQPRLPDPPGVQVLHPRRFGRLAPPRAAELGQGSGPARRA